MHDKWELYAHGYKRAADTLVERIIECPTWIDVLVYPISFLYRHYLELRLKEIAQAGRALLDWELESKKWAHHKLDGLWSSCRRILEEVWPDSSKSELDIVEQLLLEFAKTDPDSQGFRYPAGKSLNPSLPGIQHINLRNLYEVMGRVSALLEGASSGISEYLSTKRSVESYYSP